MRRRGKAVRKETEETQTIKQNLRNEQLEEDLKKYLKYEYFDINPKTDYTYARGPTYSPRHLKKPYNLPMPNMSRYRVRSKIVREEISNNGYVSWSSEDEEIGKDLDYDESDNESDIHVKTVFEEGILLRSGHSLKSARSIFERHERNRARRSLPAQYNTNALKNSLTRSEERSRQSIASDRVTSTDMIMNRKSRSSLTGNSLKTVRKTLEQEFEDENYEKGMKESANMKTKLKGRKSIEHLYGLDRDHTSDTELSSQESLSSRLSSSSSSYESSQREVSVTETTVVTVVTTVVETVASISKPVVEPVWNTVGRPVWYTVGQPIWNAVGRPVWNYIVYPVLYCLLSVLSWTTSVIESAVGGVVKSLYHVVEYITLSTVLSDVWLLQRRRSRSCCLCLPLLLLLPFLILSGKALREKSLFPAIWSMSESATVISQNGMFDSINLREEVKRIIIQLQHTDKDREELSRLDVEGIVKDILTSELSSLKLSLTEENNQNVAEQMRKHLELSQLIQNLQTLLINNVTVLEQKLESEKEEIQKKGSEWNIDTSGRISKLEQDLSIVNGKLENLELSQQWLDIQMKNCCKNDSFYMALIHDHVNRILAQMMTGQSTGNADQDAFTMWLHTHYVSKQDFESNMASMAKDITDKILAAVKEQKKSPDVYITGGDDGGSSLSAQFVRTLVEEELLKYSADKTGLPDFALESSGGSVVSCRCSETYHKKTAQYSIFGIPLWYASNSPRTVIQPDVHPGECWAFQGSRGNLVIELSTVITPTAFSLEHIPKLLSPNGNIDSAPKEFSVYGLENEKDLKGKVLGNYTYSDNGKPLQFFPVQVQDPGIFKFIELQILSNHGNQIFTCLYRFRVHGVPYIQGG